MQVRAWQEVISIPTYQTGMPDKNPMFLEKRIYQGSTGAVYPHAVIDTITDVKIEKDYLAVFLENEYLKIMILPQLGGRIQMALDKTNDYHFVYYNRVIKPALVGLTGPWISGGIEFNWPQHHRPSTFDPVDYSIVDNSDGSKTVWINEVEQMFHTKGMAGFTLYPGKAYLEISGKLYNRTAFPQTFLWWANPAVAVDEHYQSVFPPDVHAVYDHGKRDVSSFPIATGKYYKVDYSPGTDISRYANIPVPTSFMAVNSSFDFMGGYHHQKKAGILHVADHHISPGKKQWTWGCGEFGKAWDKQLTDEDGPYIELMTGMFTDNQPDFGWIKPNEERSFVQYFMPYKNIGYVKNATIHAAVNLELDAAGMNIHVYATSVQQNARIRLLMNDQLLQEWSADLSPVQTFYANYSIQENDAASEMRVEVLDQFGKLLVHYTPVTPQEAAIPAPAKAMEAPELIVSTEELFLAAKHLEQYRHATHSPVDYYQEALRRDPFDIRNNQGLGAWYLLRGKFSSAESCFRKAIQRIVKHNPNPYDVELYYQLGLALYSQKRYDEAYEAFYKTYWSKEWQDNGSFYLARIDCIRKKYDSALAHASNAIEKNNRHYQARHIKIALLRLLGRFAEALQLAEDTLHADHFQCGVQFEKYQLLVLTGKGAEANNCLQEFASKMRNAADNYIEISIDYQHAGLFQEALDVLEQAGDQSKNTLFQYYKAYCASLIGQYKKADAFLLTVSDVKAGASFSNRLEDIEVLQFIAYQYKSEYKAWYYLGNIWYDKKQYVAAMNVWEKALVCNPDFATAHRNLGIACYNHKHDASLAVMHFEKAFELDSSDARVLFELDYLYKRTNKPLEQRVALLEQHIHLVEARDDFFVEYISMQNALGNYAKAGSLLSSRNFHPWEGGEGKVSGQYVVTMIGLAKLALVKKDFGEALRLLSAAQIFPENIGEGKLYGAQENNIHFWKGCVYEAMGDMDNAAQCWKLATEGEIMPSPAIFYNDQSPDQLFYQSLAYAKLKEQVHSYLLSGRLISYSHEHMHDHIKVDYFAVSLPDLMIFDDDLDKKNRIHCLYMEALGYICQSEFNKAEKILNDLLLLDKSHLGALTHLHLLKDDTLLNAIIEFSAGAVI